ncbi:MAG: protein phosphatase 2C domain-containing protein [Ignavibacteria bacterium]|nr:protein phosphatase 2C domain-containing protein [Ignavibacteria bacterium]
MNTYISDSIKSPFHEKNEDKILIINDYHYSLFFLFDGVGSAKNAYQAINISIRFISNSYKKFLDNELFNLSKLMFEVHNEIMRSNFTEAYSTYVAMFIPHSDEQKVSISSMGDSRLYGITNQYMQQLTIDDNVPGTENVITKSLGISSLKEEDFIQKDFFPNERRYLLSSDGFYKLMEKNIHIFHEKMNFARLKNTKKALYKDILNNNTDDASYILAEVYV